MRGGEAVNNNSGLSRNFQISLFIVIVLTVSSVLFAWTHINLNREEFSSRIGRRSLHLQNQIELMVEKHRQIEEFQRLAAQQHKPHGETDDEEEEAADQTNKKSLVNNIVINEDINGISDVTLPKYHQARELAHRFHTRYWLETKLDWPKDPLPEQEKYLTFEPWNGGFNNIRMSLEMAAAMAMALGRTLVLPPRYKMYLRGESSFQDYFDYEDFRRGFSTITYQEFRTRVNLGKYDQQGEAGPNSHHMPDYFQGLDRMPGTVILRDKHPIIGDLIGSQLVLCFPSCPGQGDKDKAWFTNVQYRLTPIDVSKYPDVFETPKVLHIKPILLGHFYTFVWFRDPKLGAKVKRAVRDHIHFVEEMFTLAEKVVKALGGDFSFSCLHVRRNEFQFKEVWTPAEDIVKNIGTLFNKGETIYIATDELSTSTEQRNKFWSDPLAMSKVKTDHAWFTPMFEHWGGREKVKFWSDFYESLGLKDDVKKIWIGSVESIVCSRARIFVGTQKSTFTGYINRLRGYMRDVGAKEMFEAQVKYPDHYFQTHVGPSWSRFGHGAFGGGHPYWGREYQEAWEGADTPLY